MYARVTVVQGSPDRIEQGIDAFAMGGSIPPVEEFDVVVSDL